jgi:hypothetical protein
MARVETPWRHRIPKDYQGNLRWRKEVHLRAADDREFRDGIIQCCSEDPIFWINGFGHTYDPRVEPFPKIPFILYDFQEEAILRIIRAIGDHDLLIEKSRDMGASWINMAAIAYMWRFRVDQSFLMVSRVEDYVDKPGNPKALFWKFDFLIDNMPAWLQPYGYNKAKHRSKMHIENPETGSVVDGESTTGRVARGDRRTAILLDEFAAVEQGNKVLSATRDATPCRLFNSTPEGTNNAFYETREKMMELGGDNIIRLHWSEHPKKSEGLYTTDDGGNLRVLDVTHVFPTGYKFRLDGKLRSQWYDHECDRAATPQEIAQELDIDYMGSGWQFFKPDSIELYLRQNARPAMFVGDLEHDALTAEPIRFRESDVGRLQLWVNLKDGCKFPDDMKIVIGVDVSAGTGASNSTIMGYDIKTCAKAFEYANPYIRPEGLALQAVALAKWSGNAFIIWERNGPGRQTGAKIVELGYGNIYYQRQEEAISHNVSKIPGWASTRESKLSLISEYRNRIERNTVANYSRTAIQECLEYIYTQDGGVTHSRATSKKDPTGAKANHGDRVIADALAIKGFEERKFSPEEASAPEAAYGSLAWRNKMREEMRQSQNPMYELPDSWRR